jgi:hypothetical protein
MQGTAMDTLIILSQYSTTCTKEGKVHVYYFKCNPTTRTYYGANIKPEAGLATQTLSTPCDT